MSETTQTPPPDKPNAILVMEPDVLVRMVIADYLRECGYKVIEATSADEALTILNTNIGIEMVFSGAQLQNGDDGFSLAHRIRLAHPSVEIILTSSLENAAHRAAEVCGNGSRRLLTKPYNPQEVVRRIHVLRERHRTSNNPRT
jgi:DNA-binding response OmpR family regulator